MKRWPRVIILIATVLLTVLAGSLLQKTDLGNSLEQATYDRRFKLRGTLPEPPNTPVTILAVDEDTFSKIGKPLIFWQSDFASVVNGLASAGASAVGIDFIFGDVSEWDPEGMQQLLVALLTAPQMGVPVILGYRVGGPNDEPLPPMFVMAAGAEGVAYVNLTTDTDDFVRRQELFSEPHEGQDGQSFAMALTEAYLQQETVEFPPVPGSERTMLINYRGLDYFEIVPFWEAWEAAGKGDQDFFKRFEGRIVLIGEMADQDRHATPLYYWVERSELRPMTRTPGVEIHGHTIATLVEGDFMRQLPDSSQVGIALLLSVLVAVVCFYLQPVPGVMAALVTVGSYLLLSQFLFSRGTWVYLVGPLSAALLTIGVAQAINYIFEGRQRRQLRNLFNRYVDDDVVEQILASPNLTLDGEKKNVAILFSDIRSFTNRSESMDPSILVSQLNRYFEKMVRAIQSNHGTIDKFMGDGIMAIFGAPLDDDEAGLHSVQAAQSMLSELKVLNAEFAKEGIAPIGIGVGIHLGEAVVGNIGSSRKLEYTAIGDVVNAASRIEGLTRKLDADVLISAATFQSLQGRIPAEYLGDHGVKGKSDTLGIYRIE